jgi:hypothetical protein
MSYEIQPNEATGSRYKHPLASHFDSLHQPLKRATQKKYNLSRMQKPGGRICVEFESHSIAARSLRDFGYSKTPDSHRRTVTMK